MLWNSQPFTAFIISIFRRLHEYSGPTGIGSNTVKWDVECTELAFQ